MRIGIDMRMAGTGEGIGRYAEELVVHIAELDKLNKYFLLVNKITNSKFLISKQIPNPNFQFVKVHSSYYSWFEQSYFIWELLKLKLDLVHFASFNVPIFYPGKFVVTIHDIIHHLFPGRKKFRWFHRLAYRLTINAAAQKAAKIITVSQGTKNDIVKTLGLNPNRIAVIPEGADHRFFRRISPMRIEETKAKYGIFKPYLLFVGVWRQYKNLPRLSAAFDIIRETHKIDCQLVLAGKIDPSYPEIEQAVFRAKHSRDIKAVGFVPDGDLRALYQGASAFVLPSLVEGFGLIGIEAQAAGAPVAASDIPVLREVLGGGAAYFDPRSAADMAEKINMVLRDDELNRLLRERGIENVRKYGWEETAKKTLEIYHAVSSSVLIHG